MAASKSYRVKRGLTYIMKGETRRAEPGDTVDDLPADSVPWLLEQGHIEQARKA